MKIKIDTKERFKVVSILEPHLTAMLAVELLEILKKGHEADSSSAEALTHLVVVLSAVEKIEKGVPQLLANIQKEFYAQQHSFVYCGIHPDVEGALIEAGVYEMMNITPTESEAWDILQMEEIERELMNDSYN
ncbi:MAG: STAS domain-containing protein [Bacteroidetes bacterium]|nr:STAS domain-containing protein [Bacteroidota bacterium]